MMEKDYDYILTFFIHSIIGSTDIEIELYSLGAKNYCFTTRENLINDLMKFCKEKSLDKDRYYEIKVKVHKSEVDDFEYYHEFFDCINKSERKENDDVNKD